MDYEEDYCVVKSTENALTKCKTEVSQPKFISQF